MRLAPRVHFSFRSPYSWMAITKLLRQVPDAHRQLEFIPYWDPDQRTRADLRAASAEFHYQQMSKAKHLYVLHDTRRQAARLGLTMIWPIDIEPWWELPHLGFLQARRLGQGADFYTAVMAARWERGDDVCDEAVIRRIGAAVGIDGGLLVDVVHSAEIRAEAADCLVRAYHDDIFGVPYFRIGRQRFWGLDRVDDFVAELEGYATGVAPDGVASEDVGLSALADRVAAFDTDTAGGCG